MNQREIKCECPETSNISPERECLYLEEEKSAMNHKPNECKGINDIRKYRRGDKELYLCSCCVLFDDIEIKI